MNLFSYDELLPKVRVKVRNQYRDLIARLWFSEGYDAEIREGFSRAGLTGNFERLEPRRPDVFYQGFVIRGSNVKGLDVLLWKKEDIDFFHVHLANLSLDFEIDHVGSCRMTVHDNWQEKPEDEVLEHLKKIQSLLEGKISEVVFDIGNRMIEECNFRLSSTGMKNYFRDFGIRFSKSGGWVLPEDLLETDS